MKQETVGLKKEIVDLRDKYIEQSLIGISARISDALELAHEARKMAALSEEILVRAHLELEDLYTRLYEDPASATSAGLALHCCTDGDSDGDN